MKYLFFLFIMSLALQGNGQCSEFDKLLKDGDNYLKGKSPNYQEAINAYTAALFACQGRAGEAKQRISKMVNDIKKLKDRSSAAEEKARAEQSKTEIALKKADKLINAFYFYDDKFALAYADGDGFDLGGYYFIDKLGNSVLKLGTFSYAEIFNIYGFSKVRKHDDDDRNATYLLDTMGNTYKLAERVEDLIIDSGYKAIDLSNNKLTAIPEDISRITQ